ncbi:MAG: hypothetical protein IPM97_04850 [Bdellovibrionaceae bacterium]|nr:hypothetical protein [Pseudobdellovibrionaceae bacterium]
MALLFAEGFEQYTNMAELTYSRYYGTSAMPGRWGVVSGGSSFVDGTGYRTAQPGGVTAKSIRFAVTGGTSTYNSLYLPQCSTMIIGFAYTTNAFSNGVVRISSSSHVNWVSSNDYLTFNFNGSGQVTLLNNRTGIYLIATPVTTVLPSVWYYVEIKVTYGISGSAEIRLDNLSVGTATSVDTRTHTSDTAFSQVCFGFPNPSTGNTTLYYDDLYVCDDTGATNNDFLGPVSIFTLFPAANGSTNQFTPTGVASNWDAVNEQAVDTATYVSSSTTNHVDKYNVTDLPYSPSVIHAVGVGSMATKTENSARQYRNIVTVGGTTSNGVTASPALNSYYMSQDVFPVAPGGSAWTASDVNSMEIGVECL